MTILYLVQSIGSLQKSIEICCQGRSGIRSNFNSPGVLSCKIINLQQLLQFCIQQLISLTIPGQQQQSLIILQVLFFLGQAIETQVYALVINWVCKFCSSTTTSYFQYLSSPFSRAHRLVSSFAFLQYFYKDRAVRFAYSSLLIRSSSVESIGHILASKDSIFSSTCIQGLRYSGCNNIQVYNKIFTAI